MKFSSSLAHRQLPNFLGLSLVQWPVAAGLFAFAIVLFITPFSGETGYPLDSAPYYPPPDLQPGPVFTVTKTADTADSCRVSGCSLREAILAANALVGANTITVPAGEYALTIQGTGEDAAATGDLDITDDLTITGAGRSQTIIDGGALDRVFQVLSGVQTDFSKVTIRNGEGRNSPGGGILNQGSTTLTSSTIEGNEVDVAPGGGIANFGTMELTNSSVSRNAADANGDQGGGGGISNFGTLTITNTSISENVGGDEGGGLHQDLGGTMMLINSTVSNNTAIFSHGGGLAIFSGDLAIYNSTITGNSTGGFGGGIWLRNGFLSIQSSTITDNTAASNVGGGIWSGSALSIRHTIVADNPVGGNCVGGVLSLGYNLDSDGSCNLIEPTDLGNTSPLLGVLHDNGGPTETHGLLTESPAVDAIPVADCVDIDSNPINTDQRGVTRPQGAGCDIGAFEVEALPVDLSVSKSDSPDPVIAGDDLTYTLTATNELTGTNVATGVFVVDTLPSGVTFKSAIPSQGATQPVTGANVVWEVGELFGGQSETLDILVTVDSSTPEGTILTNTATVSADQVDLNPDNNTATVTTTVTRPNSPPIANAGPDRTIECIANNGATLSLDGSGSVDPDGDPLTFLWTDTGIVFDDATSPTPSATFPLGTTTVTLRVSDPGGLSDTDSVDINVEDTTSPTVGVVSSSGVIWPANHKYVPIDLAVAAEDNCSQDLSITATAHSSEPDDANGNGDGRTDGDIKVTTTEGSVFVSSNDTPQISFDPINDHLELRAERGGGGSGRVYTIVVTTTDGSGNQNSATTLVTVPHDRR